VYIREKAPAAKKQKAKNIIEIIVPKRNMRLVAKRVQNRVLVKKKKKLKSRNNSIFAKIILTLFKRFIL
jgi:hypothetical protein